MTHQDKHQPHPFEPIPDTPIVYPNGGDAGLNYAGSTAMGVERRMAARSSCGLCGAPREDRRHIEGEAIADGESPNWG